MLVRDNDEIVVESDSDKYSIIEIFKFNPSDGIGCASLAIKKANDLISDLMAGRVSPKEYRTK